MRPNRRLATLLSIAASLTIVSGCGDNGKTPAGGTGANQASAGVPHKAGAQLWAENCSRCHNLRPPQSFSDAQWQTVVHHMRLRADLTGEESRKITEFLQASH